MNVCTLPLNDFICAVSRFLESNSSEVRSKVKGENAVLFTQSD